MYGFHDFDPLDGFGASDADGLVRQSTMGFADAAARDAALTGGLLEAGMRAYTADDNTYWAYTGGAWVIECEPSQTWAPTISQPGSIARTVQWGWYQRSNGLYRATCRLNITASGSGGNPIIVSTPFTHIEAFGSFAFFDTSLGAYRVGNVLPQSTTEYCFVIDEGIDLYGVAVGDGVTNGDALWLQVTGSF